MLVALIENPLEVSNPYFLNPSSPPSPCSHPWETVTQAAWRKYPNPISQGVIGTDVVDRKVVDGVLHSHRIVSSKWFIPQWAQRVSKGSICGSGHSGIRNRTVIEETRDRTKVSTAVLCDTDLWPPARASPQDN